MPQASVPATRRRLVRLLPTPFGMLEIGVHAGRLERVSFTDGAGDWRDAVPPPTAGTTAPAGDAAVAEQVLAQLAAYFEGRLRVFDLPLAPAPTAFAADLRAAMLAIPYGRTAGYGDLADRLGSGARAVGRGCGANPLPIVVPCHRVVASTGLGGYSGGNGLKTKSALLDFETGQAASVRSPGAA